MSQKSLEEPLDKFFSYVALMAIHRGIVPLSALTSLNMQAIAKLMSLRDLRNRKYECSKQ